ncbi:MAG: nucleotidyltransferase domain-containing protein [bacterium]
MTQKELLQRIDETLAGLYGDRYHGLVLYGSRARGDAREDSDIDLPALLEGPVETCEIRRIVQATYQLRLESEQAFHIVPGDLSHYEDGTYAIYREAKKEGLLIA